MTPTCFLDTNILIEAARTRPDDERKSAIAQKLVLEETFGISTQSVAEFVNASAKARISLAPEHVDRWVALLFNMPFVALDPDIVRRGVWLSRQYEIQYYDAALLAAAERLRCEIFYSDDLSHGQV